MIFRPQGLLAAGARWPGRCTGRPGRGRSRSTRRSASSGLTEDNIAGGPTAIPPARRPTTPLLEIDHVTMQFGGLTALERRRLLDPDRRDPRADRPERRRQDDCFNVMTGVYQPTEGEVRFQGQPLGKLQALPDHQARPGPHVPEHPPVPGDDRAGERQVGADAHHRSSVGAALLRLPRLPARGGRGPRAGDRSCSSFGRHRRPGRTTSPRTCPTATSAAWRSPGRWPPSRSCCASTSRPPASTRPRSRT